MVNLFISAYPEKDPKRKAELHTCLMNNLKSGCFDAVWVIAEDDGKGLEYFESVAPYTVNILPCTTRPTFRTFFEAINTIMDMPRFENNSEDMINIISNSDIYVEDIPVFPQKNQVFALTRYELEPNGNIRFLNRSDSQDVFMFRSKIRIPNYCNFANHPGSDNRICKELALIGYEVLNPSLTIKTFHLHRGAKSYDNNTPRIKPPYLRLNPIALNQ